MNCGAIFFDAQGEEAEEGYTSDRSITIDCFAAQDDMQDMGVQEEEDDDQHTPPLLSPEYCMENLFEDNAQAEHQDWGEAQREGDDGGGGERGTEGEVDQDHSSFFVHASILNEDDASIRHEGERNGEREVYVPTQGSYEAPLIMDAQLNQRAEEVKEEDINECARRDIAACLSETALPPSEDEHPPCPTAAVFNMLGNTMMCDATGESASTIPPACIFPPSYADVNSECAPPHFRPSLYVMESMAWQLDKQYRPYAQYLCSALQHPQGMDAHPSSIPILPPPSSPLSSSPFSASLAPLIFPFPTHVVTHPQRHIVALCGMHVPQPPPPSPSPPRPLPSPRAITRPIQFHMYDHASVNARRTKRKEESPRQDPASSPARASSSSSSSSAPPLPPPPPPAPAPAAPLPAPPSFIKEGKRQTESAPLELRRIEVSNSTFPPPTARRIRRHSSQDILWSNETHTRIEKKSLKRSLRPKGKRSVEVHTPPTDEYTLPPVYEEVISPLISYSCSHTI